MVTDGPPTRLAPDEVEKLRPYRHVVGFVLDSDLAAMVGVPTRVVARYRLEHLLVRPVRVLPAADQRRPWIELVARHHAVVGVAPDAEVARRAGLQPETVAMYRRVHRIAPPPGQRPDPFPLVEPERRAPAEDGEAERSRTEVRRLRAALALRPELERIHRDDVRYSRWFTLSGFAGDTAAAAVQGAAEPANPVHAARSLAALLDQVTAHAALGLDEELRSCASAVVRASQVEMVVSRCGLGGHPVRLLEEIGLTNGLTRERIRQITSPFDRAVEARPPWLPALDRFLEAVRSAAPLSRTTLTRLARQHGSDGPWEPEVVCSVATRFGRALDLVPFAEGSVLGHESDRAAVQAVDRVSRGAPGVRAIGWVAADVKMPPSEVARVAPCVEGFEWLVPDADDPVFWLGPTNNRLVDAIRKVLSVASPVRTSDLTEAVARAASRRTQRAASQAAVVAVCRRMEGVAVDEDRVRGVPPPPITVLSALEQGFVELCREEGPTVRYARVRSLVRERGLHGGNTARLRWSPIVVEVGRGGYRVVAPLAAARVEPQVRAEPTPPAALPSDALALARLARTRARHRPDQGHVVVVGHTVASWTIPLDASLDDRVRERASRSRDAVGVALVRPMLSRAGGHLREGVGVFAEMDGQLVETWAALGDGITHEWPATPVDPGERWLDRS